MVDWIRRCLYLALIVAFFACMYNSFSNLLEKKVSSTSVSKSDSALLFPSVTMCPVYNEDFFNGFVAPVGSPQPFDTIRRINLSESLLSFRHSYEKDNR